MNIKGIEIRNGTFFSVEFIKRTTGEPRKMVCRTGVVKHLTGGGAKYDAGSKGLLVVYDVQKRGYRSIPLEAVTKVNGIDVH